MTRSGLPFARSTSTGSDVESGETRIERRRGSEHGRAGRSGPVPDLLDIFPSQRSRDAADILAEVAAEHARDELEYQRTLWKLDIERRQSLLDHQQQMELQTEWKGALELLRAGLIVVMLCLAIGELASDGALVTELLRLVRSVIP